MLNKSRYFVSYFFQSLLVFSVLTACTSVEKTETPREREIRVATEELNLSLSQKIDLLNLLDDFKGDLKSIGMNSEMASNEIQKLVSQNFSGTKDLTVFLSSPLLKLADKLPEYFQKFSSFYGNLSESQKKAFFRLVRAHLSSEEPSRLTHSK